MRLRGGFKILFLYDVAEALDGEKLQELLGPGAGAVKPGFARRTPEYVHFSHPPIIEPAEAVTLETGERLECSIKYYTFAVVAAQFDVPFDCDWKELLVHTSRWMDAADVAAKARAVVRLHMERIAAAVIRPNQDWLQETYLVVSLQEIDDPGHERPTGAELISENGASIAQLLRGETNPLAPQETEAVLRSWLSYFPRDLVVASSSAALVYGEPEDAAATTQILEYGKMQLLEFRYYDGLMSQLLSDVYAVLERKRNVPFSRWTLPRDAERVNRIRLDVMELTERIDNALKFVSDVYYARVYRMAASRMGVAEYRDLVEEKVRAVGELYDFMVQQFNEVRSFVLEVVVGIIVLMDVVFWFAR